MGRAGVRCPVYPSEVRTVFRCTLTLRQPGNSCLRPAPIFKEQTQTYGISQILNRARLFENYFSQIDPLTDSQMCLSWSASPSSVPQRRNLSKTPLAKGASAHCPRIGRANLPVCLPGLRMNLMGVIRNGRGEEGGPAGPPCRGQCARMRPMADPSPPSGSGRIRAPRRGLH
jgi:hypothetical protein